MYFNRDSVDKSLLQNRTYDAFRLIWIHFKASYSNKTVVLWSFYYAVSFCFFLQITVNVQVLWISIYDAGDVIYNGYIDAVLTFFAATMTLLAGKIPLNLLKRRNLTMLMLIIMSTLQGIFIVLAATRASLMPCYIFYVCYGISYAFSITICASEIAKLLSDDAYGLVFGFNTLIALALRTIVVLSVVSNGFKLTPSGQFQTFGYFCITLGGSYLAYLLFDIIKAKNKK